MDEARFLIPEGPAVVFPDIYFCPFARVIEVDGLCLFDPPVNLAFTLHLRQFLHFYQREFYYLSKLA